MIWHIVRFDLGGLEDGVRTEFEQQLAGLAALDVVAFVRVARDVLVPEATGLIVGLADEAALDAYREDPDHGVVLARIRELELPRVALDIVTDDDPRSLA